MLSTRGALTPRETRQRIPALDLIGYVGRVATVLQTIHRLLPAGTVVFDSREEPCSVDWIPPPEWPPDLFAVCATLVSLSGCYAHAAVTGGTANSIDSSREAPSRVRRLGRVWREADREGRPELTAHLAKLWRVLLRAGHEPAARRLGADLPDWCAAALELLALADEASAGIGFNGGSKLAARSLQRHWTPPDEEDDARVRRRTATICELVPPEECCVQPKARTPQVGCTLRSLTHHLALLPPIGEVTTRYLVRPDSEGSAPGEATEDIDRKRRNSLNLLLVPYPYAFGDAVFRPSETHEKEGWGRFRLERDWLPPGNQPEQEIADFLVKLAEEAVHVLEGETEHAVLDGLVLPELALPANSARAIANALAERTALDLFITGTSLERSAGWPGRNAVASYLFTHDASLPKGRRVGFWQQAKHHRWRLDRDQIDRYGFTLPHDKLWWEDIDVANREVVVYAFRESATLTTLVCEDLARIDPVQHVVRAVGPNLLVALLMDGSQHEWRWPGRYATVLADDPGTSVLTLTCLGMVDRHRRADTPEERSKEPIIGLWKDSTDRATELRLPRGAHALLLRLGLEFIEERTMDRRSDEEVTVQIVKRGLGPIRVSEPPAWASVAKEEPSGF